MYIIQDSELPEDNQRIVQEANEQLSGLDIVIANAGWTRFADRRDIYDLSFEEWDKARRARPGCPYSRH
jgi:NAD(P)-dependent dehydrogenase (short-subunit alcohol dehydrogenase family)